MTPTELEEWLETDESLSTGGGEGGIFLYEVRVELDEDHDTVRRAARAA